MAAIKNKKAEDLRKRAENLLDKSLDKVQGDEVVTISELAQELAIHQTELELQNEELLETQQALQEAKDRFTSLYEYAPVGYVILDASGTIRQANTTWCEMLNRRDCDLRGEPFSDVIIPEDKSIFLSRFRTFFRNPLEKQIIVRVMRKNDGPFHARIEAAPHSLDPVNREAQLAPHNELMVIISNVSNLFETQKKLEDANLILKQTKEKVEHTNRVLMAIRKVTRLIYSKNDPQQLVSNACESLVESMAYYHAWAVLFDDDFRNISFITSSGLGNEFDRLKKKLFNGEFPKSLIETLKQDEPTVVFDPTVDCPDCPLASYHAGKSVMSCRFSFEDQKYGALTVSVPADYVNDSEEINIFYELSKEIAFALHKINLDKGLKLQDEKLNSAMQLGNLAWWEMQMPSGLALCDDRKIEMLDRDPKEFRNVHYSAITDLLHPDDYEKAMQSMRDHLEGRAESYHVDYRIRKKDGSYIWYHDRGGIIDRHDDGSPKKVTGIVMDITDRKRAEDALRTSENLLVRTQQIANVGSWMLDLSTNHLTWSDQVYRIFGLKPQDFQPSYEAFIGCVHPDDRALVNAAYADSLRKSDESYEVEHRVVWKDTGEIRHVYEKCIHERNSGGEVVRSVGMVMDITHRKQLEEHKADVERVMRHDLKAPLNAIIGFPQLIESEENLTDEQVEFLKLIELSGRHMLQLIDLSLDMYKIETGKYPYMPFEINAAAIVKTLIKQSQSLLSTKNLSCVIELDQSPMPDDYRFMVPSEERLLIGLLSNLFKNAIEASPKGEKIRFHFSSGPKQIIAIENVGAVPSSIRDKFFEKYVTYGKKSGTGLGTYSAKLLARAMGYELAVGTWDEDNITRVSIYFPTGMSLEA